MQIRPNFKQHNTAPNCAFLRLTKHLIISVGSDRGCTRPLSGSAVFALIMDLKSNKLSFYDCGCLKTYVLEKLLFTCKTLVVKMKKFLFTVILYLILACTAFADDTPQILLRYEGGQQFAKSSLDLAIIDDSVPGVENHSSIFSAEIQNYDELKQKLQGEPQWSVTYRNNPPQQLELKQFGDPKAVYIWTERYTPTTECTIQANINITWDTLSYSFPMDINFVKVALPENYTIPSTVYIRSNMIKTYSAGFGDYSFSDAKIIKASLDDEYNNFRMVA